MKSDLTKINSVLEETIKKLKLEKNLKRGDVINGWSEIIGDKIAKKTKPVSLKNGLLVLKTESSTWAQELSFMEETIIKKINEFAGEKLVKKVRFKN